MKIGVPSEVKVEEYRVAMTPAGVRELTDRGHQVAVQAGYRAEEVQAAHLMGAGVVVGGDGFVAFQVNRVQSSGLRV